MKAIKALLVFSAVSLIAIGCQKIRDFLPHKDPKVISRTHLEMSGAQEVPARTTAATGRIDISYDKKTKLLTYGVAWQGLTGIPIGSHIHGTAPRGVNAPIKHDFTPLLPKAVSGTFTNTVLVDEISIKEDSLLAGLYYINIHTPMFPGGEIRGQLEFK